MIKKVYNRQKLRAKLALYIAQARKEYKTYLEKGKFHKAGTGRGKAMGSI